MTSPDFCVQRVRHPIKVRVLTVRRITKITPHMVKVSFHSPDLSDFVSASFDDHIKLLFPSDGKLVVPQQGPDKLIYPDDLERPPARDYTPRQFRPVEHELDVEFLLHGEGPAASWVSQANVGDQLVAAGPRGSFVIPDTFDWQLLIGDETALPAIARRLEELPDGYPVYVIVMVQDATEQQALPTRANAHVIWVHRASDGTESLEVAVRKMALPPGEGYAWGAGEALQMRAIHQHLVTEKGMDKARVRVSSYWKQGDVAVHKTYGRDD